MQKFLSFLVLALFLLFSFVAVSCAQNESKKDTTAKSGEVIKLEIEGMYCVMCEQNSKKSLEKLEGVNVDSISASKGIAILRYSGEGKISDKKLEEAVVNSGFKLKKIIRKEQDEDKIKQ